MDLIIKAKVIGSNKHLDIKDGIWTTDYKGNKRTSKASVLKGLNYRIFASGLNIKIVDILSIEERS